MIELSRNYKPYTKKGVILTSMIPYKQLSLADIFTDCQEKFENDTPFLVMQHLIRASFIVNN